MSNEKGSALVISLALLLLLVVLGTSMLSLSGLEERISHNDLWSEGALHAAEAGIHVGIDRLQVSPVVSTQPINLTAVDVNYTYRSGDRLSSAAVPLVHAGNDRATGFAIGTGTGYNPSGYTFARYRINATGAGPRSTKREIEALTHYGPVAE